MPHLRHISLYEPLTTVSLSWSLHIKLGSSSHYTCTSQRLMHYILWLWPRSHDGPKMMSSIAISPLMATLPVMASNSNKWVVLGTAQCSFLSEADRREGL